MTGKIMNNIDNTTEICSDCGEEEETIPLDSQLGQDASRLLAHYFPGSTITSIEHEYHRGVFIGDYSISMNCNVTHPIVQQVEIHFIHEDVPGRPETWEELCSLPISLYLYSITMINPSNGNPVTYALPGLYQEEIDQWCSKHDDGMLVGHVETPDMFIMGSELLSDSHKEIELTAKLLAAMAKAKREQENV